MSWNCRSASTGMYGRSSTSRIRRESGSSSGCRCRSHQSRSVFPLVNKDGMPERAEALYADLRKRTTAFYDDSGSIGRRYARMDEIGTPFSVTVDHETLEGKGVTLRERDSQKQIRVKEGDLATTLNQLLSGEATFPA